MIFRIRFNIPSLGIQKKDSEAVIISTLASAALYFSIHGLCGTASAAGFTFCLFTSLLMILLPEDEEPGLAQAFRAIKSTLSGAVFYFALNELGLVGWRIFFLMIVFVLASVSIFLKRKIVVDSEI
ncbi:MAG: hypothetical protein HGA31_01640 [Candidatus Moranbacteria bacterium]|nr:hypothetical protein [Candidatus Moranbacteria bacterium]